ncbi:MAG: hypothetical protein A3J67_00100 [Parcubacteria group bacterium RIFCSPHIGHO2_02_FULL_48_10b]|nr:MAG: hypothetical protein A3J67_00100 [Parcubacteria group bacterium RIFCSPHIGHO2_02_FULL_48_10b]
MNGTAFGAAAVALSVFALSAYAAFKHFNSAQQNDDDSYAESRVITPEPQLGPEPAVVRTNQPFTMTIVEEHVDLSEGGEIVEFLVHDMRPDVVSVHPFELLGVSVTEDELDGWVRTYVTFTMRIISPAKGVKKIPPIWFKTVRKRIGDNKQAATTRTMQSDSIVVFYVTSVAPSPYMNVRYDNNIGSYAGVAKRWGYASWMLPGFGILFILFALVTAWRSDAKRKRRPNADDAEETFSHIEARPFMEHAPAKAWSNLKKSIEEMIVAEERGTADISEKQFAVRGDLHIFLFSVLGVARNRGPKSLREYVENNYSDGRYKALLIRFVDILEQSVQSPEILSGYSSELNELIGRMRWDRLRAMMFLDSAERVLRECSRRVKEVYGEVKRPFVRIRLFLERLGRRRR